MGVIPGQPAPAETDPDHPGPILEQCLHGVCEMGFQTIQKGDDATHTWSSDGATGRKHQFVEAGNNGKMGTG